VLPKRLSRGTMSLLSHVVDGAVEATWSWSDVVAESC
jgi:hypothetical protein